MRHDVLLIGSLSAEQVELHEKALKENRIKQQELEVKKSTKKNAFILMPI